MKEFDLPEPGRKNRGCYELADLCLDSTAAVKSRDEVNKQWTGYNFSIWRYTGAFFPKNEVRLAFIVTVVLKVYDVFCRDIYSWNVINTIFIVCFINRFVHRRLLLYQRCSVWLAIYNTCRLCMSRNLVLVPLKWHTIRHNHFIRDVPE